MIAGLLLPPIKGWCLWYPCSCFVLVLALYSLPVEEELKDATNEIMHSHGELSRKPAAAVNLVLRTLCPAALSS